MRVFCIVGYSNSGKTHTAENVIRELKRRGYSVGSVKEIHCKEFAMDEQGTDTNRHKEAGAGLVTARGNNESNILYQEKLSIDEILKHYDHDFVLLEGVEDYPVPKIITAHDEAGILAKLDDLAFLISGRISDTIDELGSLPAISALTDIKQLVDLIEEKVQVMA